MGGFSMIATPRRGPVCDREPHNGEYVLAWTKRDREACARDGGPKGPWFTVVGVVDDVKNAGLDRPAGTELYLPYKQAEKYGFGYVRRDESAVWDPGTWWPRCGSN